MTLAPLHVVRRQWVSASGHQAPRVTEILRTFPAILLCLLAVVRGAEAQQVIMSPPVTPVIPPALQEVETNRVGVIQPGGAMPSVPETQPFQWGPLDLRPHFLYRFLYGNGIQASAGHPLTTATHEISPGFLMGIGRNWILDYTPTWTFHSNNQFRDTLDHYVTFSGGTAYGDWVLGLSQSYASSDQPLVETGGQTAQETYSTALNASYRFGRAMSVDLAVNQNFTFTDKFTNSREWSTMDWLNYQFWPRMNAGLGVGAGYVDVSAGNDSTYEQYQGRVNWRATDKISLQVHGGVEDRQFYGAGTSDLINPIYGAAIQYQPFEVTALSLSATRTVSTSPFQNEVTENTDLSGSLNQRLLKRFNLSLGAGYHTGKYIVSAAGFPAGRKDEYYSFNVRLSTTFLKRGTIAASYQFSNNSSDLAGFGYSSSQVGLEVGYRF
jgi:predicted porin